MQIPKLRYWREAQALTQAELAERAGISPRSVAGYEAGAGARPGTVRKLAAALDVGVGDLRGDEGVITPHDPKAPSRPSEPPQAGEGGRRAMYLESVLQDVRGQADLYEWVSREIHDFGQTAEELTGWVVRVADADSHIRWLRSR